MSAAPLLQATGLTVGYRRRGKRAAVLGPLDLSVAPGDLVCLLGPNGIGKSTLLRTLAGLQRPLAGGVAVNGGDLFAIRPFDRARLIGVVLSERIGVGALRARQMVALGRYAHGGWSGRLTERDHDAVERALASVGASHLADRDCRELSDGEAQKLNLARALAQEPAIVVLDEPTAFLDVAARVELMALLRRLTRESGVAVVASTHDLDLALRQADSVWLVDRDRALHSGCPEDLVLAGLVNAAFSDRSARFDAETLRFRATADSASPALVIGPAPVVGLAMAVLEREGFHFAEGHEPATLTVEIAGDGRWRTVGSETEIAGQGFAALAAFARRSAAREAPATRSLMQSRG